MAQKVRFNTIALTLCTLLSIVRNICPPLAVLPQAAAILLYTACRLSLDSVASTSPVVPSFLAPYLCAAISCGDVSNVVKATKLATIHLGIFPGVDVWISAVMIQGGFRWLRRLAGVISVVSPSRTATTGRCTEGNHVETRWDTGVVVRLQSLDQPSLCRYNLSFGCFKGEVLKICQGSNY